MRYIILIIAFSIVGCNHTRPIDKVWVLPEKPKKYPVEFVPHGNGVILSETSTVNLAKNFDEIDAYQMKLEFLIQEMKKYYKGE